ncbi:MAG: ATP-dependent zinc metalloprotease FtsH [Clostridia bacterium]|nr:ATP-dependent zinc metalloprotease FtsH [Clostridia bacterium]MBQ5716462.1 ATP-dependent zinc metalloprotease FtsH [Clostridia bacterium]MBQ9958331.1 ATP-dependent zinc metalloprotease FtsH [Clostridia bacterium]
MVILIPILIFVCIFAVINVNKTVDKQNYSAIVEKFYANEISEFELNITSRELTYKQRSDNKTYKYTVPDSQIFYNDINEYLVEHNKTAEKKDKIEYNYLPGNEGSWIVSFLPTLLTVALIVFFFFFMSKRMGKMMGGDSTMGFGKAKAKKLTDDGRKTMFTDVAGADEEKAELEELVEFLKNPKKFNDMGARIPKGVLLVGPPGTGKTLLARAVAGEAGVPFFSISGSDFVEMFVGVGASRVRDLFDQAKKNSPAIIFIDEIDAVGRQRGAGLGGGHDEREQTLNQLLVEMDGFGVNQGVIIIAATNRPDILDKALLRPGRFDRQITVNYPDVKGREEILKVHARGKPLGPDVELKTIAKATAGFTGADLENLLNEAALLAVRNGQKAITEENIEEATIKVIAGAEKKSWIMKDKEKLNTAYHEAGHAITGYYLPTQDEVHQITIIPRGRALGMTISLPSEDKFSRYQSEMEEELVMLLGGRIAESIVFGDVSTGAANDIERATQTAKNMVVKFGMSGELGPILYGSKNEEVFLGRDYGQTNNCSEQVAAKIDAEVHRLITTAYKKGEQILTEHRDKLDAVAKYLVENEKMDAEQFKNIMTGKVDTKEEISNEGN